MCVLYIRKTRILFKVSLSKENIAGNTSTLCGKAAEATVMLVVTHP